MKSDFGFLTRFLFWALVFFLAVVILSGCATKPKIQYVTKTKIVYVTIDDKLFDCPAPPVVDPDFWEMEAAYNKEFV